MFNYFSILLLFFSSLAFGASGSGNISNTVIFGPSANPFAILPFDSLISGTGSGAVSVFKILSGHNPSTASSLGYNSFIDPATGAAYQVGAGNTVTILGYSLTTGTPNTAAWQVQVGYSGGPVTVEGGTTAPTTPVYNCGGASKFCLPASSTGGVPTYGALVEVIPSSKYIWFQVNAPSPDATAMQLYIKENP